MGKGLKPCRRNGTAPRQSRLENWRFELLDETMHDIRVLSILSRLFSSFHHALVVLCRRSILYPGLILSLLQQPFVLTTRDALQLRVFRFCTGKHTNLLLDGY